MRLIVTFALFFFLLFTSCNKESQLDIDRGLIEAYLTENNLDAMTTDEGVYYIITQEGEGDAHPTLASEVTVRYKGYFLDGTVFDETTGGTSATFPLRGLIEGWQIGIPLLKKNGKGTFFIPSDLGYGSSSTGSIPPNSVLAFDIELLNFN